MLILGPIWNDETTSNIEKEDLLVTAIQNSLVEADNRDCNSISIPAISSGIYGCPTEMCGKCSSIAIKNYLDNNRENTLRTIRIVIDCVRKLKIFTRSIDNIFT